MYESVSALRFALKFFEIFSPKKAFSVATFSFKRKLKIAISERESPAAGPWPKSHVLFVTIKSIHVLLFDNLLNHVMELTSLTYFSQLMSIVPFLVRSDVLQIGTIFLKLAVLHLPLAALDLFAYKYRNMKANVRSHNTRWGLGSAFQNWVIRGLFLKWTMTVGDAVAYLPFKYLYANDDALYWIIKLTLKKIKVGPL